MKHIKPLIERISDTDKVPVKSRIEGLEPYPSGFTDTADTLIDIEADIDKKYHRLLLHRYVVKNVRSLSGWRFVSLTAREWIAHLCAELEQFPTLYLKVEAL